MKIFTPLMVMLLCIACVKKKQIPISSTTTNSQKVFIEDKFKTSYKNWNILKNKNDNSYSYTTTSYAIESGYIDSTTIIVKNGIVSSRIFKSYQQNTQNGLRQPLKKEWYTEKDDELGTHKQGFTPITIDELYNFCKKNYLSRNSNNNRIYLKTDTTHILKKCGYVANNCTDDCYQGVDVVKFRWLKNND